MPKLCSLPPNNEVTQGKECVYLQRTNTLFFNFLLKQRGGQVKVDETNERKQGDIIKQWLTPTKIMIAMKRRGPDQSTERKSPFGSK